MQLQYCVMHMVCHKIKCDKIINTLSINLGNSCVYSGQNMKNNLAHENKYTSAKLLKKVENYSKKGIQ